MNAKNTIPIDERDIKLRDDFRNYIIMVRDDIERILDGLPDKTAKEAKDIRWLIADLTKTRKELLSLEGRIADAEDADPTHRFDFNARRREIGRRLDKLRAASGTNGVSKQPDGR